MASSTTNLDLTLPVGGENVSRQIINANNVKIDEAVGPVPSGTDLQSQVTALNNNITTEIENRLFVDKRNATSYQIPITGKEAGAYWFALMYTSVSVNDFSLYSIFINADNSSVTISKIFGSDTRTYTGSVSGSILTITVNDNLTVWAGIRVIKMN